jgi:uncharacterized protein (UPF0248 family)
MPFPRDILNELKWREGKDLAGAEVWYLHRGAPDDTMVLPGSDIVNLGRSFIETDEASIPYHRVLRIVYDGRVLFER